MAWKRARLARSVEQLVDLAGELYKQGVQFKCLTDAIDTGMPSGHFFFVYVVRSEYRITNCLYKLIA